MRTHRPSTRYFWCFQKKKKNIPLQCSSLQRIDYIDTSFSTTTARIYRQLYILYVVVKKKKNNNKKDPAPPARAH